MARWIESWVPGSPTAAAGSYPGEQFGLPRHGVNAAVGFGRRFAAITVDWMVAFLIAPLLTGPDAFASASHSWTVMGVWFLLTAVPVAVFGASAGMTALGIRVASIGDAAVIGVPRSVLRTALIALVVPPLVRDTDGRGWHDRATRTIVVRTRA